MISLRGVPAGVRVTGWAAAVAVYGCADFSPTAQRDPFRWLFLGAVSVQRATADFGTIRFTPAYLLLVLGVGLCHVEIGHAMSKRGSDGRLGLLLMFAGVAYILQGLRRSSDPTLFTIGVLLTDAYGVFIFHLFLAIPSGRLESTVDRWLVGTFYVVWPLMHVVGFLIVDERARVGGSPQFGLLIADLPRVWAVLAPLLAATYIAGAAAFFGLVAWRYRHGGALFRRAFNPVLLALVVAVAGQLTTNSWSHVPVSSAHVVSLVSGLALPLGAAVSVRRSHPTRTSMSTILAELGRSESTLVDLQDSLRRCTGDDELCVARLDATGEGYLDVHGTPLAAPRRFARALTVLHRDEEPVGALLHDAAVLQTPEVWDAVRRIAALALDNDRLIAELRLQVEQVRRSRRRMLDAGDEQRHQLERDLHDGVQQSLLAALMSLDRAAIEHPRPDLVHAAEAEVRVSLRQIREIARGIHPPLLHERGLVGAVESMAERAALPVRVLAEVRRSLPHSVSITAYYVASEAIANAVKHAAATSAEINIREDGNDLLIEVSDDGRGGARIEAGGGLAGLADRTSTVGGQLRLDSGASGTTVSARLPLVAS